MTATRTQPPHVGLDVLRAALAQARADFARGGDLRALALAWTIERRIARIEREQPSQRHDWPADN